MKGIILAGGKATRLEPVTTTISKQIIPIYDKPMIYYPLSALMLGEIKDILIISTPEHLWFFERQLGDGKKFGMNFSYAQQEKPKGLADAFIVGEDFVGKDNCCLILGDNIFYGHDLPKILKEARKKENGATIFGYEVQDPQRYGIVEFDKKNRVVSIEEKPKNPKSNYAVVGLYFYDNKVIEIAKSLTPSQRGELEITDVNKRYLELGELEVKIMGRGFAWLDTGTFDSLYDASTFVKVLQTRQGNKISCIEEIAYNQGFINKEQLRILAKPLKNSDYGEYLLRLAKE